MSEFFANLDRYRAGGNGGGDRGAYLRLYNGGPYSVDRIGRGPFTSPNWSGGFPRRHAARPNPEHRPSGRKRGRDCCSGSSAPSLGLRGSGADRKPSAAVVDRYNGLFPALAALRPPGTIASNHPQTAVFHRDAHQHREAIDRAAAVMANMPDTTGQLRAAYGKWTGLFARVALTFHMIELADASAQGTPGPDPMVISEPTARRVAGFMLEIVLPHLLRAHRLMFSTAQTSHAEWIAGYILAERLGRITSRDVVRAYRALKAPEARRELEEVMESLVTIGWLEPEVPANKARRISAWAVNPAVHVRFGDRADQERARRARAKADAATWFEARQREKPKNSQP